MKIAQKGKKKVNKFVNKNTSEKSDSEDSFSADNLEDKRDSMLLKQKEENEVEDNNESSSEDSEDEESDDDTDSESDDNTGNKNGDFDHQWEELRKDAPDTNEITRRIAVCNMDWDRIRAVDLLVCFNSFKPTEGHINSVKIYPSEFGLKRMEEEKLKGPQELVEETLPSNEKESSDKKGSKYHREKLRQYQISRLKYYYAVVDCDAPETANTLYEQLNGMEYESSSIRFDLRFIPDDVTFDHEPKSVAEKLPDLLEYKPRLFVTSALQQVKVDLTWDETDPRRREFLHKVFADPDSVENDLQDFLASASSESEEEIGADKEIGKDLSTKEKIAKYRELLLNFEEKEKEEENKYDIEVTWEPALKEKAEDKVKEKMKTESLNPFEELLLKKKEGKKLKKKEQKIMQKQTDDSTDSEGETSAKSEDEKKLAELALISDSKKETNFDENIKKRKKVKSEELEGFVADMNDPRFSAMHTSSLFNMIPSDKQPKKEGSFGLKRQKKGKFKSKNHEGHKNFKKAKYH